MQVCFINPPITPYRKIMRNFDCATESKGNYLYQPYDFLLMTGKIPAAWPIEFIDAIASPCTEDDIFIQLNALKPDILVCSLAATNWSQDLAFVKKLREKFQDSYLFVFGDLFIDNEPVLEIKDFTDGIFTSPVMFDFSYLMGFKNRLEFSSKTVSGFRDLDFYTRSDLKQPISFTLQNIRHHLFLDKKYRWPFAQSFKYTTIFTAWGCPYSCSYCILNKFPNYWRSFTEIIDEMIIIKKSGIRELYIGDRSFGLPLNNIINLLTEMIDKEFNFSWSTYFHPNQYTPELLDLMKESGCHTIIIGIESANFTSLKRFGRHMREEQFFALLRHAQRIKMNICGDFIIGLPGENTLDIKKTLKLSRNLKLDFASYNIAAPLAGSLIRELAISNGGMQVMDQGFDSFGRAKIVSVCNESENTLRKLRDVAIFRFYARPSYIIKRLFRLKNFEHFLIQFQEALLIFYKLFGFK